LVIEKSVLKKSRHCQVAAPCSEHGAIFAVPTTHLFYR